MKVRLPGLGFDLNVASEQETEAAAFYVCVRVADVPEGYFDDDLIGVCSRCRYMIRYRPYAPKTPRKLCMQCAAAGLAELDAP